MNQTGNTGKEMTLMDLVSKFSGLIRLLISKWWIILAFTLALGLLGYTYGHYAKPKYRASSTMILENQSQSGALGGALDLAQKVGIVSGGGATLDEDKVLEIVGSRRVITTALLKKVTINGKTDYLANHLIDILNLQEDFAQIPELKNFRFTTDNPSKFTYYQDSIMGTLCSDLAKVNISVTKNRSKILEIAVTSKNEMFSKIFNENLLASVTDYYVEHKTQKNRETADLMQNKVDSISQALNEAEINFAKSKDASGRVIKAQGYIEQFRLQREMQVLGAMFPEAIKNLEVTKFNLLMSTPLIQIIDAPILPLEKKQLGSVMGTIIGAVFGFLFGMLFVILQKLYKDSAEPQ